MDESLQHESVSQPMKLGKSVAHESFEGLFHEYWALIYRLLLRMVVDPAEAEDLALETFFRLHKHQNSLYAESNIRGWLYKVATNLALHSIRSFKRREQYELNAGKGALEEATPDQPLEIIGEEEERRTARSVLAQMNSRHAEILIMRYSGMTYNEIAAALNLSPTSIGPLLLRAERDFEKRYRACTREEER